MIKYKHTFHRVRSAGAGNGMKEGYLIGCHLENEPAPVCERVGWPPTPGATAPAEAAGEANNGTCRPSVPQQVF